MAICTSAEPVSDAEWPNLAAISAFCSLLKGTVERAPSSRIGSLRVQVEADPSRRPGHHTKRPRPGATVPAVPYERTARRPERAGCRHQHPRTAGCGPPCPARRRRHQDRTREGRSARGVRPRVVCRTDGGPDGDAAGSSLRASDRARARRPRRPADHLDAAASTAGLRLGLEPHARRFSAAFTRRDRRRGRRSRRRRGSRSDVSSRGRIAHAAGDAAHRLCRYVRGRARDRGALEALYVRDRTGLSTHTEIAIADGARALRAAYEHGLTAPGGPLSGSFAGYGLYRTADGWVALAALERHFQDRVVASLGVASLERPALEQRFIERSTAYWQEKARQDDLPLAAIE